MRIIHVVLAGWMLITVSNTCFGKEWRGITPLKSSRADVERLLGRPTGPLPTYYLSDVTVTFWYSRCRCGEKSEDDCWNVPVDTVVSIYVTLKGVNRLADLGLDLTRFKKTQGDYDVPGSFRYSNAEEGFGLEGGEEYVNALIYGPRTKDERLRCPRDSPPLKTKGNEWRGIVPLHSTRADVEKLLGPAKPSKQTEMSDYETENEEVTVLYASGPPCSNNGFRMWKVPHDTVVGIIIHPKKELLLANLNLDDRQYKKTDSQGHGPPYFYYTNEQEGHQYEVTQGRIMSIVYTGTAKDKNDLRCTCLKS